MTTPSNLFTSRFDMVSYPADIDWISRFVEIQRVRPDLVRKLGERPDFEMVPVPRTLLESFRAAGGPAAAPAIPGGLPDSLSAGASAGPLEATIDALVQPERFIGELDPRVRALGEREVARNYPELVALVRSFASSLEAGDIEAAMKQVSSRYYDQSGADSGAFKARLTKGLADAKRSRVIFTGARDVAVAGSSIGATLTGAYDIDGVASEFTADVVFEREDNRWKIAAFDAR